MSGPKSSRYTLTAAQRALLLEQQRRERERKLEEERLRQETARHDALCRDLEAQLGRIKAQLARIDQLQAESGRTRPEAGKIRTEMNRAASSLQVLREKSAATSAERKEQNAKLQEALSSALRTAEAAAKLSQAFGEAYHQELASRMEEGYRLSFSGLSEESKAESPHLKRIQAILAKLDTNLPKPLQQEFEKIQHQAEEITDEDYLENFCSIVVTPFAEACRACKGYDEALEQYRLLCAQAHVSPQAFPCTAEGMQALAETNQTLEQAILADHERAYINGTMDAILREMGYKLVGNREVTKRSTGKHTRHELYSMENGTAVDVTFADNGQISMELGGLDTKDRAPTAEESEQLVEDMHSFCKDYALLEKKLAERGITTAQISHQPPSAEFAQIFNTNDYELTAQLATYQAEEQRHRERKLRRKEG